MCVCVFVSEWKERMINHVIIRFQLNHSKLPKFNWNFFEDRKRDVRYLTLTQLFSESHPKCSQFMNLLNARLHCKNTASIWNGFIFLSGILQYSSYSIHTVVPCHSMLSAYLLFLSCNHAVASRTWNCAYRIIF